MPEWKDFLAAFVTVLATFVGAWVAFALERSRRRDEEVHRNVGAVNRALYTLLNFWNVLEQYRKDVIEPHRGKSDAWFNMAATPFTKTGLASFEAGELIFLLQTKHAQLFASLMLEEQRFAHAISLMELRSSLMLNDVFPKFADAEVKVGATLLLADAERIAGIDTTHKLKVVTESLIKNIDEDLCSIVSVHNLLRDAIQNLYPKRKLIQIQFGLDA